ncbi:hypothetical protein BGZ75_009392 [Mortierella antarctica]|nr:hypothetical protein BGZ75_009392 [Mortierella antarctica]
MTLVNRRHPRFLALVATILAFSAFLAIAAAQTKCKENEFYTSKGSACPPTCDTPNPTICSRNFVPGCFCKDGLVRAKDGNCVPFRSCKAPSKPIQFPDPDPSDCKKYEVFDACSAHCEPTCETPQFVICNKLCIKGCVCKAGLVRAKDGSCIPVKSCKAPSKPILFPKPKPSECMKYEVFDACGAHCEPTCEKSYSGLCNRKCNPGCVCKRGRVRAKNGDCVRKSSCKASAKLKNKSNKADRKKSKSSSH